MIEIPEFFKKPIKLRFLLPVTYIFLVIFSWFISVGMKQAINDYLIIGIPAVTLIFSNLLALRFLLPFVGEFIIEESFHSIFIFLLSYLYPTLIFFILGYFLEKIKKRN